jgi:hypothetical protein
MLLYILKALYIYFIHFKTDFRNNLQPFNVIKCQSNQVKQMLLLSTATSTEQGWNPHS